MESVDGYAKLRNGLHKIAVEREDWAGIPMPLDDLPLHIEPTYPRAEGLMAIGASAPSDDDHCTLRNSFVIESRQIVVLIWNEPDGRIEWGILPTNHRLDMDLSLLKAADAWGIEQENNAVRTLGTMLHHRQFKQYLLTGQFLEQSQRSGVHYLFRRLKPTVALRETSSKLRILCALCMHPIGYYQRSWAGAMTPTDDVVAHLAMMRGDEVMFWRRSNQHGPKRPEAGL